MEHTFEDMLDLCVIDGVWVGYSCHCLMYNTAFWSFVSCEFDHYTGNVPNCVMKVVWERSICTNLLLNMDAFKLCAAGLSHQSFPYLINVHGNIISN